MVQRRYVLITFSNTGNLHARYYKDNCFRFCATVSQSLSLSQRKTGGGPAEKPPTSTTAKIISLLGDEYGGPLFS
jgi:hypothetical protein